MSQAKLKGRITEMVKAAFVLRLNFSGPLQINFTRVDDEETRDEELLDSLGSDYRWATGFEGLATSEQSHKISFEGNLYRSRQTGGFTKGEIVLEEQEIVHFNYDPDDDGVPAGEDTD